MWFGSVLESTFFCKDQVCSVVLFGVLEENFTVSLPGSHLQAKPQDIQKLRVPLLSKKTTKEQCLATTTKLAKMSWLEHASLVPRNMTVCHAS
jgi:hypothetical protein